jgi:uncharacterized protein (TIGR02284 family)
MKGITMDNDKVVSTLNDLIETCKDGEEGFRQCADGVNDPTMKSTLMTRAQGCATAAGELQGLVRAYGGDPETGSSISGSLHRRWVDVKSTVTGKDETTVLNECERGEDVAMRSYQDALKEDLPPDVRQVVERQYQGVKRNHDEVKAMRNQARARNT